MIIINHFASSIKGRRDHNQDAYLIKKYDEETYFFAVADGMGGLNGGGIASSLVLEISDKYLQELIEGNDTLMDLKLVLNNLFRECQLAIKDKLNQYPDLQGMGTTLVCVLVHRKKWVAGNLGDSRLYHINSGSINQISIDHTYVQEYINTYGDNLLPAIKEKYENVLVKALDGKGDEPDIFPIEKDSYELKKGDKFLLCSDGLILDKTNQCSEILGEILNSLDSVETRVNKLINWGYESGSTDNITAVIVEVE